MHPPKTPIPPSVLNALLDYIAMDIEAAKTTDEIAHILEMGEKILCAPVNQNTVSGIDGIRVCVDPKAIYKSQKTTLELQVPGSLNDAFQMLAKRMRLLERADGETFKNASQALRWLANGNIVEAK